MRILHTSDWHLGRALCGERLLDDQAYVLDQLTRVADDFHPDAVLVAADVYDRAVPAPDAVHLLDDVVTRLVLDRDIHVFMIAGKAAELANARRDASAADHARQPTGTRLATAKQSVAACVAAIDAASKELAEVEPAAARVEILPVGRSRLLLPQSWTRAATARTRFAAPSTPSPCSSCSQPAGCPPPLPACEARCDWPAYHVPR